MDASVPGFLRMKPIGILMKEIIHCGMHNLMVLPFVVFVSHVLGLNEGVELMQLTFGKVV